MNVAFACLVGFGLLGARAASAQGVGVIEGRVVVQGSGAPLADASVLVDGSARGSMTDAAGRYRLAGLAAGEHVILVQRLGHAAARKSVVVAAGGIERADFELAEAAVVVAPVVVSATREAQRRADASATIEALDGVEIRRTRASHPSGILNRVPGVHVSDLTGEGHSTAIRQPISTKPLYLFLEDGIPTRSTGFFNHNALYEVNIPQAGGIEVLKGPGTALYGSDAVGGVVNVLTRPAPPSPTADATVEGGAYGYRRLLVTGGTTYGATGLRADLNLTQGDGWKDGSAFDRHSGTVRWDVVGSRGLTARTVLAASKIDQHEVPALSTTQFDSTPTLNKAPIAFRNVRAVRLSSAVEKEAGASLWSVTPYARYNAMELLPNWQLSFDPQVWDTRNKSVGLLAKFRHDFAPLRTRVIVGADADYSPGSFKADGITPERSGPNGIIWSGYSFKEQHYDYDVTYRGVSPYVHAELSPLARLRVDAGLRYDVSGYVYKTKLPPLETGAHRRPADAAVEYYHLSPKLGASLEVARAVNIFASYRHGFRAPSQGQLFQQNTAANTVGLKPAKVDSYEGGVRGQLGDRFLYQLSAYDMSIEDDVLTFVTPANTREAVNAGETRHRGVELGFGAAILPRLRLDVSYSRSEQKYVRWVPRESSNHAQRVDYSGNLMETAPRDLHNVLLTYSPSILRGGRVALEWTGIGRYAMDPENTHFYNGYDVLHLHVNAHVFRHAEVFARLVNLTDEKYGEIVTYDAFQREQFTPGAPRSLFAGLRYSWER